MLDLWRGALTPRRAVVLISQLPPGSRLRRALGGAEAWSEHVAAIHIEGQRNMAATLSAAGVKSGKIPKPVEPPKPGWKAEAEAKAERQGQKAARWIERNNARETDAGA